jgi:hypothetical protein
MRATLRRIHPVFVLRPWVPARTVDAFPAPRAIGRRTNA